MTSNLSNNLFSLFTNKKILQKSESLIAEKAKDAIKFMILLHIFDALQVKN